MIVRARPSLLRLFFVTQGSIVPRILPQVLLVAAISVGVILIGKTWPHLLPNYSSAPFALVGIAISVFLNFRNSACYDRWWEARRHWGELILFSRTLSRQTLILPPEDRARWLHLTCAFAHALVKHLRPGFGEDTRITQHLTPEDITRWRASLFPPDAILRLLAEDLARLRADGRIGDIPFQMFDKTLADMSMVQTTCERIRTTPVPFGYTLLLHRTAYLFCFLLPFGFAEILGWATLLASVLVAYTFFGLDALGDELEEPFGLSANNLPLSALAETIELNMREALGETGLPPLPQPVNHVLI